MHKYLQIDQKRIFLRAITSFEHQLKLVESGEVVDRQPVAEPTPYESLKISLLDGREIEIEGKNAAAIAKVLEEKCENVGVFELD